MLGRRNRRNTSKAIREQWPIWRKHTFWQTFYCRDVHIRNNLCICTYKANRVQQYSMFWRIPNMMYSSTSPNRTTDRRSAAVQRTNLTRNAESCRMLLKATEYRERCFRILKPTVPAKSISANRIHHNVASINDRQWNCNKTPRRLLPKDD